jgi:hypothetical protein
MRFRASAILRARVQLSLGAVIIASGASPVFAQLDWEGQSGGLINPYAYTLPSHKLGTPELAFHYLNGGPVLGGDYRASFTIGFLKIGEIGYTRVFNSEGSAPLASRFVNGFNIGHIKFSLVPENAHHWKFLPAIAAGSVVRTQVRRLTEVTERENTTCTDFFVVATKTFTSWKSVPIVLNLGEKVTNASLMGVAANSPVWQGRLFGGASFAVRGPLDSELTFGAEFAQQPRELKEIPGPMVPTTLAYSVRVQPKGDTPLHFDFGLMQLGGNLGSGLNLEARHQFTMGASYRF